MSKNLGFTMAEILLSLTIIGVIAAITLPSLMANINERTWNTQRKALYARMSQAIAMMPNLNGYGEYEGTNTDGVVTATKDTAAEAFLTEGLSKVLKINNICDAAHLTDCGIASSYTNLAGSVKSWSGSPTLSEFNIKFTEIVYNSASQAVGNPQKNIDTKAAAFETLNGESVLTFYNPYCSDVTGANNSGISGDVGYQQQLMCANFIYDLNGNKGPNTVGKDIGFITAMYASMPTVVSPMPLASDAGQVVFADASKLCLSQDVDSRLPNIDELASMFYNTNLIGLSFTTKGYWSGTRTSNVNHMYYVPMDIGARHSADKGHSLFVRCVKR